MRRSKHHRAPGRPCISGQPRKQILELSTGREGQARSQREIARLVGVAQGTVARVLRNPPPPPPGGKQKPKITILGKKNCF